MARRFGVEFDGEAMRDPRSRMDLSAVPVHPAERTPCKRFTDPLAFV